MLESLPYIWGRQGSKERKYFYTGITPVYMGKTFDVVATEQELENHPRIYGEDTKEGLIDQHSCFTYHQFFFSL